MVGQESFLSRSSVTGAEYIDVFAPLVTAPHRQDIWPDVMVLDSQPMRRRTLVGSDESARVASDFLCEVVGVLDGTTKALVTLYPAGGKDQELLKEVFATKKGRPSWIVTDGDPAMAAAIGDGLPRLRSTTAARTTCARTPRDTRRPTASPTPRSSEPSRPPSGRRSTGQR